MAVALLCEQNPVPVSIGKRTIVVGGEVFNRLRESGLIKHGSDKWVSTPDALAGQDKNVHANISNLVDQGVEPDEFANRDYMLIARIHASVALDHSYSI